MLFINEFITLKTAYELKEKHFLYPHEITGNDPRRVTPTISGVKEVIKPSDIFIVFEIVYTFSWLEFLRGACSGNKCANKRCAYNCCVSANYTFTDEIRIKLTFRFPPLLLFMLLHYSLVHLHERESCSIFFIITKGIFGGNTSLSNAMYFNRRQIKETCAMIVRD